MAVPDFEGWLSDFLEGLNVDGEVYGGYISGTLRTLEGAGPDEAEEALSDILTACIEDEASCSTASKEIVKRWQDHLSSQRTQDKATDPQTNLDTLVLSIASQSPTRKSHTHEGTDSSIVGFSMATGESGGGEGLTAAEKRHLVDLYGCEEDEDEGDPDEVMSANPGSGGGSAKDGKLLQQNTNRSSVLEAVKQLKVDQKASHVAKVERDRKSRDQQQQKQQDRKEKEKKRTQKGERRRH